MNIDEIKASVRLVWKGLLVTQPKLSDDAIIEEDVVEEMTMLFDLTIRRLLEEASTDICMEIMSNKYEGWIQDYATNCLVDYVKERLTPATDKLQVSK